MGLDTYTDQQSRMDTAFSHGASCCDVYCEACGRCYFVTSAGHGDYEPGELDRLRELAEEDPDHYVEVPDFSSVATMTRPTDGKHVVIGCVCDPTETLAEFIEKNSVELTVYLREYWKATRTEAARQVRAAADALAELERR